MHRKEVEQLIDAYMEARNFSKVESLLTCMVASRMKPTVVSLTKWVDACGKTKQVVRLQTILELAKSAGVVPTIPMYNALIKAYAATNNLGKAEEILGLMMHNNVEPNARSFTPLVSAYGKQGNYDKVLGMMVSMRDLGVQADAIILGILIDATSTSGGFGKVNELLHSLREAGAELDVNVLNAILKSYHAHGHRGKMDHLVREFEGRGVQPDLTTFNILMRAHAEAQEEDQVGALIRQMTLVGIEADVITLHIVMKMYVESGRLNIAESMLHVMKHVQPDDATFHLLIDAYCRSKNLPKAEELIRTMRDHSLPCDNACNILLLAYLETKDFDKLESLLGSMSHERMVVKPDIFRRLLHQFASDVPTTQVQRWLAYVDHFQVRLEKETLLLLFGLFQTRGTLEMAEDVLNRMIASGLKPPAKAFEALLMGYGKARRMEGVHRMFARIKTRCETDKRRMSKKVTTFVQSFGVNPWAPTDATSGHDRGSTSGSFRHGVFSNFLDEMECEMHNHASIIERRGSSSPNKQCQQEIILKEAEWLHQQSWRLSKGDLVNAFARRMRDCDSLNPGALGSLLQVCLQLGALDAAMAIWRVSMHMDEASVLVHCRHLVDALFEHNRHKDVAHVWECCGHATSPQDVAHGIASRPEKCPRKLQDLKTTIKIISPYTLCVGSPLQRRAHQDFFNMPSHPTRVAPTELNSNANQTSNEEPLLNFVSDCARLGILQHLQVDPLQYSRHHALHLPDSTVIELISVYAKAQALETSEPGGEGAWTPLRQENGVAKRCNGTKHEECRVNGAHGRRQMNGVHEGRLLNGFHEGMRVNGSGCQRKVNGIPVLSNLSKLESARFHHLGNGCHHHHLPHASLSPRHKIEDYLVVLNAYLERGWWHKVDQLVRGMGCMGASVPTSIVNRLLRSNLELDQLAGFRDLVKVLGDSVHPCSGLDVKTSSALEGACESMKRDAQFNVEQPQKGRREAIGSGEKLRSR